MRRWVMPSAALCLAACLAVAAAASAQEGDGAVPSWVRQTAGWWSDGIISDAEFLAAIRYLMAEGVLVVDRDVAQPTPAGTKNGDCRHPDGLVQVVTWSFGPKNSSSAAGVPYERWLLRLGGHDAAREAVEDGLDAWATDNRLEFRESAQPSACGYPHLSVVVGRPADPGGNIGDTLASACLGCLHEAPEITLNEQLLFTGVSTRNVVAHEFGHVLGLEHNYGDPLHLMREFYARDVHCTPIGLSGRDYYTGLEFSYDDLGLDIPEYLFVPGGDGRSVHPVQHPSSTFFAKTAQYDRVSRTLYVTFSQDVLDADLSYLRMTGSSGESSTLRGAEAIYQDNVAEIALAEERGEKFDGTLCAHLDFAENAVRRYDTTFMLPQTLVVEVVR